VVTGEEAVVGGAPEECALAFVGIPEELSWRARIAPEDEPGEALTIEGVVRNPDGSPAPGVVIYAYHTDTNGIYPDLDRQGSRAATRHGVLRAWVISDERGRYRFDTIRPAGYPDSRIEQHVHMHVIEPRRCTYWIDSVVFDDDERLTDRQRREARNGRGGGGGRPRGGGGGGVGAGGGGGFGGGGGGGGAAR